jgi:hypothetical protein
MTGTQGRPARHVLTPAQLASYRHQLEHAIAFFARQYPVPPVHADLQAALRDLPAAQRPQAIPPRRPGRCRRRGSVMASHTRSGELSM